MKTTKTIAAVLAVFLALALFAGAASAATVYVYEYAPTSVALATPYYLFEGGSATGDVIDTTGWTETTIAEEGLKEGLYSTSATVLTPAFTLKYPSIGLLANINATGTSIEGKTLLKTQTVDFAVSGATTLGYSLSFTTPAGGSTATFGDKIFTDGNAAANLTAVPLTNVSSGTWSATAKLETKAATANYLIKTTPSKYLSSDKITFTVGGSTTNSIVLNKESIIRGGSVLLTINGPLSESVMVNITAGGFNLLPGTSVAGPSYDADGYIEGFNVTLSSTTGAKTIQLDSNTSSKDKSYTVKVTYNDGSTKSKKVTIEKGVITASAGQDSYYIGNEIKLSGTNTESDDVGIFIKGSNINRQLLVANGNIVVKDDDTWSYEFDPTDLIALDAGTYTFYAVSAYNTTTNEFDSSKAYATVSVSLKQPFLTGTAESGVVAKGDKIKIAGTAEAASTIYYYVFGTNKFVYDTISVDDNGAYSVEVETDDLSAGQYFVVIQHPMYDTFFNIAPIIVAGTVPADGNYDIYQNPQATPTGIFGDTLLFNTLDRQSANAAEALCQALDTQNIDDIYVKLTFIVAQKTLTMNPVSDVAKGSALKVSGTTNLVAGTTVTVDVLSTAFTAVEKTSVNSASFITLSTKVVKGADGVNTWEVTFDTTGLNVDTYTIQALVDDLSSTSTVKVLDAAPTTAPTTAAPTTAPTTAAPTATPTQTPGFGAFLALAGLGAVAVLVLRRD